MLGLNQTFSEQGGGAEAVLRAGYYAVLDASAERYPREKFWVDGDRLQFGDTLEGSRPVTGLNYMLFRIERRDTRSDWDELTSIRDPYQNVVKALQAGNVEQAQVHLRSAITAAMAAPELTKNVDRRRVVEQLKTRFEQDKKDLGAGAFKRAQASLSALMRDALTPEQAAAKPPLREKEAFTGV